VYSAVLWDWNGTLLNDVEENICIVNELLAKRSLPGITKETYKRFFRMPIKDFYKGIGFDFSKESFEKIAHDYNEQFTKRFSYMPLTSEIEGILKYIEDCNITQYIVSASEQKSLDRQVSEKNISKYFKKIVGNDDYSVVSKIEKAKELRRSLHENEKILFIGDMYHDYEVAEAIGADCILYRNGHQETKENKNYKIINRMEEIKEVVRCFRAGPPADGTKGCE
jgi:phosphoglycolate phosphatase